MNAMMLTAPFKTIYADDFFRCMLHVLNVQIFLRMLFALEELSLLHALASCGVMQGIEYFKDCTFQPDLSFKGTFGLFRAAHWYC